VPPNAIDLVEAKNILIEGNLIENTDQVAIGVYANCVNVEINSNIIIDPNKVNANTKAGIFSFADSEFVCCNNTIINQTSTFMEYGIVLQTASDNQNVFNNTILGETVARIGKITGNPTNSPSSFTGTGVTASTVVSDIDLTNKTNNIYSKIVVHPNWQSWVPNIVSSSGTLTTTTVVEATFTEINNTVFLSLNFGILDAGTGSGEIRFNLPVATNSTVHGIGIESVGSTAIIASTVNSTTARILGYNAASVIGVSYYSLFMTYRIS
jgi:hypothetical protein